VKTLSPALQAHYAQGSTTLARCWKCTRVDGAVLAFTNHDVDIVYLGVTYVAATGFTPSAIQGALDLSVANLEVTGVLDSASITEADLLAGKWDNCAVEIFEVNYNDLTMGRMLLPGGKVGNVSTGRVGWRAELRGVAQALQQPVGGFYTKTCTANLGDAKCTINIAALSAAGIVATAASRVSFATAMGQAADTFGGGVLTWVTGLNAGAKIEVNTFVAGAFVLAVAMPFNIVAGDTFAVTPGCRKRRTEDCKTRYNNVLHFRGFPDVPGNDIVIGSAGVQKAAQ
jgi:uncharacterized phage protein (TIGR02218 family)